MNPSHDITQFMHLPGFKFCPTDEELVDHYLKRKMLGQVTELAEVNIYDFKPEELPGKSAIKSNGLEWYFFAPRIYKYEKSRRSKRTTKYGYWKVTGVPRNVMKRKVVIANKKSLVFYTGRTPNGIRSKWIIHEYNPTFNAPNQQNEYVVCKLMTRADDVPTMEENGCPTTTTDQLNSNIGDDQCSAVGTSNSSNYVLREEDDELEAHLKSFESYNEMDYSLNYVMSYEKYM